VLEKTFGLNEKAVYHIKAKCAAWKHSQRCPNNKSVQTPNSLKSI
jgi:hypothetical protein